MLFFAVISCFILITAFFLISLGFCCFSFSTCWVLYLIFLFIKVRVFQLQHYCHIKLYNSYLFGELFYALGLFSSIPTLYSLIASCNILSIMTFKYVSKNCQVSPVVGRNYSLWRTTQKFGNWPKASNKLESVNSRITAELQIRTVIICDVSALDSLLPFNSISTVVLPGWDNLRKWAILLSPELTGIGTEARKKFMVQRVISNSSDLCGKWIRKISVRAHKQLTSQTAINSTGDHGMRQP